MQTPPHSCEQLTAMQRCIHIQTHGQQNSPYKSQLRQVKDQSKLMRPPHHAKDQHNLPYMHASKPKQTHDTFTFHTRNHG